ncbi:uncharacterized protein BYT42DRAFT_611486 [Radiomyces spectabilis]|uniref:uncharacterized protein n=1 Tax=Radiomyces spectabilis TaxID=64574 RepID=UPI002220226C|nr:uncharacterized protein BYT42DRAFT_611486 [Radiomyces spectabilis]KAI8388442.1 hypothetical protein BYT42DRAFT_611486 [Radiomyces spectabilis]
MTAQTLGPTISLRSIKDYLSQQQQQRQQSASQVDADGSRTSSVSDRLRVNNFDPSLFLLQLQLSIDAKWKHSLEEHMHPALASTSILLLTPTTYSPLISFDNWKATVPLHRKPIRHQAPTNADEYDHHLTSIVNDLLAEKITRKQALNEITFVGRMKLRRPNTRKKSMNDRISVSQGSPVSNGW